MFAKQMDFHAFLRKGYHCVNMKYNCAIHVTGEILKILTENTICMKRRELILSILLILKG